MVVLPDSALKPLTWANARGITAGGHREATSLAPSCPHKDPAANRAPGGSRSAASASEGAPADAAGSANAVVPGSLSHRQDHVRPGHGTAIFPFSTQSDKSHKERSKGCLPSRSGVTRAIPVREHGPQAEQRAPVPARPGPAHRQCVASAFAKPHGRKRCRDARACRAGSASNPPAAGIAPGRATGNRWKGPSLLSKAALPSPLRPDRAVSVVFLGAALALGGVATAGAAPSSPAASVTAAAARPSAAGLAPNQRLLPAAVSGPQATMPMTPDRLANATTIVRQAMDKHLGLRSAVIAVATAMQESTLQNLQYGTYDSLGLFQQRPSAGWGTPAQVTDPVYASDAFLNALRQYQASNPGWATQPLWQAAQGVQNSGFPYAYAKWEVQAAQVVADVASHMF